MSMVPDTDELAEFRELWKEEIRGRVPQPQQHAPGVGGHSPSDVTPSLRPRLHSALEAYALAVSREQSGNYPEATRLYRNAFRLDPNVDKAYHRDELARTRQAEVRSNSSLPVAFAKRLFVENRVASSNKVTLTRETLATLLKSWPNFLPFAPLNKSHGVPIDKLPDELVVFILSNLAGNADASTVERFGLVSRRARLLSLDSTIWRNFVQSTMVSPQLDDQNIQLEELAALYHADYRRVYVEHPRLRFDGAYISICHYVRNGLGENPWVTISHLVTYRRFLRFLPDGKVLSYRANEDQEIGDILHGLQPGLRRKDLCVGKWRLAGTTVLVTDLLDRTTTGHMEGDRYSFQMSLTLKSRPSLGRWNKLEFVGYESVNLTTGEISLLPLRHERPFWFSKVRSY